MPEPIPDVNVRIAVFLTFDQARVILEDLQRVQERGEAVYEREALSDFRLPASSPRSMQRTLPIRLRSLR